MNHTAAVYTISDSCAAGKRRDTSGPRVRAMLEEAGYRVIHTAVVPDDRPAIESALIAAADTLQAELIVTTGGTGLSPRDVTPEATAAVVDREIPAIPQTMLWASLSITPRAMLSRAKAGSRGASLILNLPGSEKAAAENLGAVLDTLDHALAMLRGGGHD